MRIVYLTDAIGRAHRGAAGDITQALARMAQRDGHPVVVATLDEAGAERAVDGLRVVPAGRPAGALARLADGSGCDLLHMLLPDLAALPAERPRATVTVVTLTGLPAAGAVARGGAVVPAVDAWVVPSAYAATCWRQAWPGLPPLHVLPHGVDLIELARAGPPEAVDPAGPWVACPLDEGGLAGVAALLDAWARRPALALRLRLFGPLDTASATGAAVSARIAADPRLQWQPAPFGSPAHRAEPACAVGCLPGAEPLPFARFVHQCAVLGMPCLASATGAQAEAVARLRCGECLPAHDRDAWIDALVRLAAAPPPAAGGPLPYRIEEEAGLYLSLYRERLFRARS